MAVKFPDNLKTAIPSQASASPPPGGRGGGPVSPVTAIEELGGALSDKVKEALFAGVEQLEEAGSSPEQIKTFVESELQRNGIELPAGRQRSGQLVDMMT